MVATVRHDSLAWIHLRHGCAHGRVIGVDLPRRFKVKFQSLFSTFLEICEKRIRLMKQALNIRLREAQNDIMNQLHDGRIATLAYLGE